MRIAQLSNNKKLLAGVAGVAAVAVVGTTLGYQALTNDVTLRLDGKSQQVTVMAGTVREALADADVKVSEHDVVTPSLDTSISDGSTIEVKYARPVELTLDGENSTHWVTATSVSGALDEIGGPFERSEVSVSRSMAIGRGGIDLEVTTAKKFVLKDGAKKKQTREVAAGTVGEALEALGVKTDADDRVKPALDTELTDGTKVVVTRFRTQTKVVKGVPIAFGTTKTDDASLEKGDTETVAAGKNGSRDVTYRLVFRNGVQISRKEIDATVITKPVNAQVKVGTKEPVVEAPTAPTAPNYASGTTVWDALAKCESGGNWAINTGNGYYGGLQFSASTWRAVGGSGLPHQHSREEQIKRGQILQARSGWGQWPGCSAKLGLR